MKVSFSGRKYLVLLLFSLFVFGPENELLAWTEHPLFSSPVLSTMPEVRDAQPVKVESLAAFILAEEKGLEKVLAAEETWARNNLPWYMPLPDTLSFKATGNPQDIRERFCHAIRINPQARLRSYLQLLPGEDVKGRSPLTANDLTFLHDTSDWRHTTFVALQDGAMVRPLDVAVTATDEPDLGLDIGLFTDNDTDFGKLYGFGTQPFGNPHLEYGSQAPFHMGFYHEAKIMYLLAGFLKKTYPEYRIHLYKTLSEFAFQTGHPYWGWRFMGWGLHYLGDLAQPYHATVLPRVSTARALWINTEDMIGVHAPKANAIQLVSNRHLALEKFLQIVLQRAYREQQLDNPILVALRSAGASPPYEDRIPRAVVTKLAHAKAAETDKVLAEDMPKQFVSDPRFELGTSAELEQIVERMRAEKGQAAIDKLTLLTADLLAPFAVYGRSYVRTILAEDKGRK
jgi:hypothetical protein